MGNRAGRRILAVVPWIALIVVGAFALSLLAERRQQRAEAPRGDDQPRAVDLAAAGIDPQAKKAADEAVDQALQDLQISRTHAAALAAERDAATARAEKAEALLATAEAESGALGTAFEGTVETLGGMRETLEAAAERIASLEARRAVAEDAVRRWLRDAAHEDVERFVRAFEGAEKAKKADLEHLVELVAADPKLALPAAKLLPAVKPSDASDAAVVAVLTASEASADLVSAIGGAHRIRPVVVEGVLGKAVPAVKRAFLDAVAVDAASIPEDDRETIGASIAKAIEDAELRASALRLAGILRLKGEPFVSALGAEDTRVRAAAAYALSRAPDLEAHAAAAQKALPALLKDEDPEVKIAGEMLADALRGDDS